MDSTLSSHEIGDFMSYMRQHGGFSTSKTFSAAIKIVLESMQHVTEHKSIHKLLDSYLEISMKDGNEQGKRERTKK